MALRWCSLIAFPTIDSAALQSESTTQVFLGQARAASCFSNGRTHFRTHEQPLRFGPAVKIAIVHPRRSQVTLDCGYLKESCGYEARRAKSPHPFVRTLRPIASSGTPDGSSPNSLASGTTAYS